MPRERYVVGDLVVDVGAASVTRGGLELDVGGLSFDLLVTLIRRAPDVVAVEDLVASVWDGIAVSDETVVQRVALLRRALDDDAREPAYVRSIRGRGYKLVPDVRPDEVSTRRWRPPIAMAAVVGIAVALALLALALLRSRTPEAHRPAETMGPSVAELIARAGEYGERHQQADNELAVRLYRQALARSPDEAEALVGLSVALSQSVTKFNGSDAERDEALALARRALEVAPDAAGPHYAHGLALDSRGQVANAIEAYLRADELGGGVTGLASAAYLFQIQGHLARALQADLEVYDRLPEAHYAEVQIGTTLGSLGFEDAAVVWLERADTLRPDNVFAALALAQLRLSGGRLDEAERVARRALESGIRRSELRGVLGRIAELRGHEADATTHYRQALEVSERNCAAASRLWLLDSSGRGETTRAACFGPPHRVFGEPDLEDEYPATWITAASAYARAGDAANALAFLDGGIDLGYRDADWLLLDPMLQSLRSDPGFVGRVERIRSLVEAERVAVLSAPWLPEGLLTPSASGIRGLAHPSEDAKGGPSAR